MVRKNPLFFEAGLFSLIFLSAGELAFHLATESGLEEEFTFAGFEQNATLVDASFEAAHSVIDRFAFVENRFDSHGFHLPFGSAAIILSF